MSMVADITPKSDYLHVSVAGYFLLDDANKIITRIFKAVAQYELPNVLIDCRQVKGNPTTMERFAHAEYVVNEKISAMRSNPVIANIRLAYFGRNPLVESQQRFGETVAVNRGVNVRETNSLEEAIQWLGIDLVNNASGVTAH